MVQCLGNLRYTTLYCLDWVTPTDEGLISKFQEFIKEKEEVFSGYIDFEHQPTALFNLQYLNGLENSEPLVDIVSELSEFLEIGYKK